MGFYNVINAASMASGQPEDVSQVLANFNAIAAVLNGGIDNSNVNAAAAIDWSKISVPILSYTPVWSSDTTNPTLGNGTISGAYVRIGKWAMVWVALTIGSTTTFGTGGYYISLPVNSNSQFYYGVGKFVDASAGSAYLAFPELQVANAFRVFYINSALGAVGVWSNGNFAFGAMGSGDALTVNAAYMTV